MEDTRHAIRQGRVLANEGLYERAMETWKAALNGAYTLHDYAGMFVLSMNIGEACVRIAMRSKEARLEVAKLLDEAVANLDYALQVVEQCSLREVLLDYRGLNQGVRRAEALRRHAQQVIDKLGQRNEQIEAQKTMQCSTCGIVGDKLLLDQSDECYYCKRCFEEYYTTIGATALKDVARSEDNSATVDSPTASSIRLEAGSLEAAARGLNVAVESEKAIDVVSEKQEHVAKETKEKKKDCTRYDRVELGSLADFLAGKTRTNVTNQYSGQQNNEGSSLVLPTVVKSSDTGGNFDRNEKMVATIEDQKVDAAYQPTTLLETTAHEHKASRVEDVNNPDKLQYTVAQLVELQKFSSTTCPSALLTSPVRDDGTAMPYARQKVNSSLKTVDAIKIS